MAKARSSTENQGGDPGEKTPTPPLPNLAAMAREEFGSQFHGDVDETPPPPEPKPKTPDTPTDEPPTPEGEEDDYEPGDNAQVEGDDVPHEPDQAEQPEAAKATDEEPIATTRELVEHLEADPDWFYNLKVDVKLGDQLNQIPLKDLVNSYKQSQSADEKLEQAKTRLAQVNEETVQRTAAIEQQFATAAKLVENLETQLTSDVAAVDWDKLYREDPALWSAEKFKINERQQHIQQTKAQIAYQYQSANEQRKMDAQTQQSAHLAEQNQLLMEAMPKVSPEWSDPAKVPQRKAELADYLIQQGFSRDDVMGASDHRLLVQAEKARLWDLTQGKVQLTKKRIQTVPKVMKPGARKEPAAVNLEKVREAQKKLRTSGHMEDALALLRMKQNRR